MLSLKNINLTFDRELIKNGELYVPNEQLTVLFGPSGSGKSSLLYDMAFQTKQVQMDYIFDGIDVHTLSQDEIKDIQKNQIAFVFQNIPLFDSMNLMENIRFFSSLTHDEFDEDQARQYLTDLELYLDDQTPIEHLSGGERQRLAIICALMKDTPYIFMDEPTAYLDEDNRQEFLKIIDLLKNQYHKTILIATHDELIKDVCDCLYEIRNQRIYCLKKQDVFETKAVHHISNTFHQLSVFFQYQFKKEKWKHRIFQLFLILILFISTFMGVYFQCYQNQLMQTVKDYESLQLIVEMNHNISSSQIRDIGNMEHIQRIEKIFPLVSDNNYLVCLYLESDFFYRDIAQTFDTPSYTGVYINYEVYRDTQNQSIELLFDHQKIEVKPQFQLDKTFDDYSLNLSLARIIYIPYDDYMEIYRAQGFDNNQTSFALITIDQKESYIEVLEKLSSQYDDITLESHQEILTLLDVKQMADYLSGTMMIILFIIVVVSIILLKINDYYHMRFAQVLLEANGIKDQNIIKAHILKDASLYILPMLISYIMLIGCFCGLGMFRVDIAVYSLVILIFSSLLIFVVSMIIYMMIRKIFTTTRILKSI